MFPVETCAAPRPWAPQRLQKNDVTFSLPCYTTPTTHPHTFLSTPQHRALPLPATAGAGWPQAVSTWDELYWNHSEPEGTGQASESHSAEQAQSPPTAPLDKQLPSSISLNFAQTTPLLHVRKPLKPPSLYWDKERRPQCVLAGFHFINTYLTLCIVDQLNRGLFNSTERYRNSISCKCRSRKLNLKHAS